MVLPGGADLPYVARLSGEGDALLRRHVASGGSFLGLCAGAYYASCRVAFELGDDAMRVEGDRELCFFWGEARGAVGGGFAYATEGGARAVPVRWGAAADGEAEERGPGGPPHAREERTSAASAAPAASRLIDDYSNGGPCFVPYVPSTVERANQGDGRPERVERGPASAGALRPAARSSPPPPPHPYEVLARYDLPGPVPWDSQTPRAPYAAFDSPPSPLPRWMRRPARAIAAVRCHVGAGTAVLCGTHPELPARALPPGPVRAALRRAARGRRAYWRFLLAKAGLGDLLKAWDEAAEEEEEDGEEGNGKAKGGDDWVPG